MTAAATLPHPASFRDPSGFVFERDGQLLRQVGPSYLEHYQRLKSSGLAEDLTSRGWLIPFEELPLTEAATRDAVAVLKPECVPFVSYPYEWCFSQLKDAAILTLQIARRALDFGMVLKDASAYNVQFVRGAPIFIDTLSFETYREGEPWIAYGQFCRHFLAPLALMAHVDARLGTLSRTHIDGIPLDLAARILPGKTRFSPGLGMHLHLHARATLSEGGKTTSAKVTKTALLALLDSLQGIVQRLSWRPPKTVWGDYYEHTNYSPEAMARKREAVAGMISRSGAPGTCWDLGANDGAFSRIAAEAGWTTVAFDGDLAAVERAYRQALHPKLLPLVQDFTNPSPDQGWAESERDGLSSRGPADLLLMLALVHHLAIGNNVPLLRVMGWAASLGRAAIIEFVPKSDSQVQRMLSSRRDVFPDYTSEGFRAAAESFFRVEEERRVEGSERTLFLLRRT